MHTECRAAAIGSIAVAALLITTSESRAADRVVIRIYNTYGVSAKAMTLAGTVADRLLQKVSLRATWRDCSAHCADALGPNELLVRIVAAPDGIAAQSLGCALVNLHDRTGALATVYADRIGLLASRTGVNAATLLGRAIAHELGHLLLGTAQHSRTGLMRPLWSDRELQRDIASDWSWSPEDLLKLTHKTVGHEELGRRVPF